MTLSETKPGAIVVRVRDRKTDQLRECLIYFVQRKGVHARWLDGDREHCSFLPDTECALVVAGDGVRSRGDVQGASH